MRMARLFSSDIRGIHMEFVDSYRIHILANLTMQELLAVDGVDIKVPKVGDVLEGTILSVGKNEVFIDIDGFGLGVVRGRELYDETVRLDSLKIGDPVFASVVEPENKEGNIELSFRQAGQERVWQTLSERCAPRRLSKPRSWTPTKAD
jgi:ribosomal protein S1